MRLQIEDIVEGFVIQDLLDREIATNRFDVEIVFGGIVPNIK